MSETPTGNDPALPETSPPDVVSRRRRRRPVSRGRRAWRIALISLSSALALVCAVAVGGVLLLNHLAGSIKRVPVSFAKLDAAGHPLGGPSGQAMTVLITSNAFGPTSDDPVAPGPAGSGAGTGLIMLLHCNADQQAGGVVSIPADDLVRVPGHGMVRIGDVIGIGGPTMLVTTVEHLTHVQLQHYARIDFTHVANVVNAMGGVDVTLPAATTSFGHTFHAGVNHLNGVNADKYARQPSLTQEGRTLRQQSLIRAVVAKIADDNLLGDPLTAVHMLGALTAMLTVDSNFTNAELASAAANVKTLDSSGRTFVTAPANVHGFVAQHLWQAIRHDSIAAFAKKFPSTVTPEAVP
ncbi:MAG TPA: LCP family protein [Streptosporangiaceae bacterium]|nr:LCP family protein [Streptosporangiaceae bacterium]